jgi:hypothetical protein
VDVLDRFLACYDDTVHSCTGMALSLVGGKEGLWIWDRIKKWQA